MRTGRRGAHGSLVVHVARVQVGDQAGAQGMRGTTSMGRPGSSRRWTSVRVGFVVPRTVGGAVVRNRVTRRLRAVVADRLDQMGANRPTGGAGDGEERSVTLVVVRALPAAATATSAELARDLDAALAAAQRRTASGVAS